MMIRSVTTRWRLARDNNRIIQKPASSPASNDFAAVYIHHTAAPRGTLKALKELALSKELVSHKKIWNRVDCQRSEKVIQTTQEIKRALFNWTKQDKTCKFSRKCSFPSYVQHKNRKKTQLIQLILCQLDVGGWRKEKGTRLTIVGVLSPVNLYGLYQDCFSEVVLSSR